MSTTKPVGRDSTATVNIRSKQLPETRPHEETTARMPAKRNTTHDAPARTAGRRPARGALAGLCAALICCATLALSGTAYAGEWVQVSCINPNQTAAGSAGWSGSSAGAGYGSGNSTQCGPSAAAYALLSAGAPVTVGDNETLRYTPPAGSVLDGGLLDLGMDADGHGYNASSTAVAYTPEPVYNGSNVFFQCAAGLTPCAAGSNDFTGVLALPTERGGNLYLEAGCGGNLGESCNEGASSGVWAQIQLYWADLRLTNNSTPAATNISGTLLSGEARGARELLLSATDPGGPGVYDITVQVDGQTLYAGTPDTNNGQCVAAGESSGALMFDASQPCKRTENADLPIETTLVHDGQHTLKITITDAAGNASVVYDNTITTHNAPANTSTPTISTPAATQLGSTLAAQPGQWTAPAGTGTTTYSYQWEDCDSHGSECEPIPGGEGNTYTTTAADVGHTMRALITATDTDGATALQSNASSVITAPPANTTSAASLATPAPGASMLGDAAPAPQPNGTPADENARLRINGAAHLTRSYQNRGLTITGALTTPTGQPITGATVQAQQNNQPIAEAMTTAAGTFTIHVPAGPSRTITIGYRAERTDAGYSAEANITETVGAGAALHITPRHTQPTGTITIAGQVAGPIPPGGVLVELQVHYRGQWVPFRAPRTNSRGQFKTRYQFQGATGPYPFRAQIPGGQAGYPYTAGSSAAITINSR